MTRAGGRPWGPARCRVFSINVSNPDPMSAIMSFGAGPTDDSRETLEMASGRSRFSRDRCIGVMDRTWTYGTLSTSCFARLCHVFTVLCPSRLRIFSDNEKHSDGSFRERFLNEGSTSWASLLLKYTLLLIQHQHSSPNGRW